MSDGRKVVECYKGTKSEKCRLAKFITKGKIFAEFSTCLAFFIPFSFAVYFTTFYAETRNAYKYVERAWREREHLRDLCVDGRMVLKGSLMNEDGWTWIRLISLRIGASDVLL
jgi:hypothetical protein